jgi:predicted dienelactone hydrolase
VVVAVDHPGNNSNATLTPEGMALWWERATDLSQVLDGMLADPEFGRRIDAARVGAAGFSLGGYTVLELAGAQTDISTFFALCGDKPGAGLVTPGAGKQNVDAAVCHLPEMHGMGSTEDVLRVVQKSSAISLARSSDLFSDGRIGAVFAIAPALGFTMTEDSLHAIRMPVEMVVGDDDRMAPAKDNAEYIRQAVRGARLTTLPNVDHYAFLDTCTAAGKMWIGQYCGDGNGADRDAVHAKVAAMAVTFFDGALKVK